MRLLAPLIVTLPLLAAASAPVQRLVAPFNAELAQARAEQAAAEAETAKLQKLATDATDDASRLRAEQKAAAQGIDAAEARITASDMQLRLAATYVAAHRQRLAMEQRPQSDARIGDLTGSLKPLKSRLSSCGAPSA